MSDAEALPNEGKAKDRRAWEVRTYGTTSGIGNWAWKRVFALFASIDMFA